MTPVCEETVIRIACRRNVEGGAGQSRTLTKQKMSLVIILLKCSHRESHFKASRWERKGAIGDGGLRETEVVMGNTPSRM